MAKTVTAANSSLALQIPGVFPAPIVIQGFGVDEAFVTAAYDTAETFMGVDGKMAAGYIPAVKEVTITLMANSDSVAVFDEWQGAQESAKEAFPCNAVMTLPSIAKLYTCTNGVLKNTTKMPGVKKTLQQISYVIAFEFVQSALL